MSKMDTQQQCETTDGRHADANEPQIVLKKAKQDRTDDLVKFKAQFNPFDLGDHGDPDYKQFRVANKHLLLTYKTHLEFKTLQKWFVDNFGAKTVNMAHEHGSTKIPYEHSHFVVEFKQALCSTNQRVLDYNGIHPHIRFLPKRKAYLDAITYIQKECFHVIITEEDLTTNLFDDCQGLSRADILRQCKKFAEIPGALALSNIVSKSEIKVPNIILRPWQLKVMELLNMPSGRQVYWFVDYTGGCGKSTFARYLYATNPNDVLVLTQLGGTRDAATIIDGALMNGWTQKLMILDLARAAEHKSIYEPIEQIKNGCMNTIKYQGKPLWFNSPHLVVFSNFYPDKAQLSADRWGIYNVDDKHQGREG